MRPCAQSCDQHQVHVLYTYCNSMYLKLIENTSHTLLKPNISAPVQLPSSLKKLKIATEEGSRAAAETFGYKSVWLLFKYAPTQPIKYMQCSSTCISYTFSRISVIKSQYFMYFTLCKAYNFLKPFFYFN